MSESPHRSRRSFAMTCTIRWLPPLMPVTGRIARHDRLGIFLSWTPINAECYRVLSSDNPTGFSEATVTEVLLPPCIITEPKKHLMRFYIVVSRRNRFISDLRA